MKYVYALILLLFSCCPTHTAPRPNQTLVTPVWIDTRFPAAQREDIERAIRDWNYVLNDYQQFQIVSDTYDEQHDLLPQLRVDTELDGLIIHYTTVGSAEEKKVDPGQEGVLAWVPGYFAGDMYIVSDRIGTRNLHTITMHEIGHILGAPHVRIAGSLMYPGYPLQRDCVDTATAGLILDAHARMRWTEFRGLCPL